MALHGKEKIWYVFNRLIDARYETVGNIVGLHPADDLNNHFSHPDFINIINKLEKEGRAAKFIGLPTDQTYLKYQVKILPGFDAYHKKLWADPEYRKWCGDKYPPKDLVSKGVNETSKPKPTSNSGSNALKGSEKIQAVVDEIDNEYQGLITGNVVAVASGTFENKGLSLDEQKQVLDILAKVKKVIKYQAIKNYETEDDIDPQTRVDAMEVAAWDAVPEYLIFERLLASLTYKIEVLDGFDELTSEKQNPETQYQIDLFTLRLLYNRVIATLDTKVATGVLVEDEQLNHAYIHLTVFIDNILDQVPFAKLKEKAPELYVTLMGNAEDIGEGWEYERKNVLQFYGLIEREWVIHKAPEFELAESLKNTLEQVDKAIDSHIELTKKAKQQFDEQGKRLAERYQAQFGKPPADNGQDNRDAQTKKPNDKTATPMPKKIEVHQLQPKHYADRKGVLTLSATVDVKIAERGKVKRANGKKLDQCWLVECLFKTVNSLNNGVTFSTFLGVKYDKNNKKHIKKIRNTIDEINKKVAGKGVPKKLIFPQGEKIYVDKSYL